VTAEFPVRVAVATQEGQAVSAHAVASWAAAHPLSPAHVDCAIAVMLKILDRKCRMDAAEQAVMTDLYEAVKGCAGSLLGAAAHALIARARDADDPAMRELVYEQRVLAETMISRPVMKGFKAMIREQGLFAGLTLQSCDERLTDGQA
jgi:hypothetical protein